MCVCVASGIVVNLWRTLGLLKGPDTGASLSGGLLHSSSHGGDWDIVAKSAEHSHHPPGINMDHKPLGIGVVDPGNLEESTLSGYNFAGLYCSELLWLNLHA